MKYLVLVVVAVQCIAFFELASGHGMMLSPAGRSSRWRYDQTAITNFNDNENFCGGFTVQWNSNGGKCGVCGDNYADATPRANELGGKYGGSGVIVQTYENTYTAVVGSKITANHLGYIHYDLCDLDAFGMETEECFNQHRLKFADGNDKYYVGSFAGWIDSTVVLPTGLSCKHCVLRWTYTAGNNWGMCENGTGASGCGPQETFKSCADISIVPPSASRSIPVEQNKTVVDDNTDAEIPVIVED